MSKLKHQESDLYIIQAVTNIHVGSGDNNFGIIDNQVQRDVLTNRPAINSSSLKGSLREHFDPENKNDQFVRYVFGSPPKETAQENSEQEESKSDKSNEQEKGKFTFLSGLLLTLPLRSNTKTFFRVTSPEIIQELLDNLASFDIKIEQKELLQTLAGLSPKNAEVFEKVDEGTMIEDTAIEVNEIDLSSLEHILGKDIAVMNNQLFNDYCKNLPVVARNHLENGISQNLWYEEILPRESRFYFIVTKPKNLDSQDKEKIEKFEKKFEEESLVQIGANATIGYGYTNIKKVQKAES